MTAVEHMVAWIESSREHYDRLIALSEFRARGSMGHAYLATVALGIVTDAYHEATRGGDMFMGEHSPRTILDAAGALLEWELEA